MYPGRGKSFHKRLMLNVGFSDSLRMFNPALHAVCFSRQYKERRHYLKDACFQWGIALLSSRVSFLLPPRRKNDLWCSSALILVLTCAWHCHWASIGWKKVHSWFSYLCRFTRICRVCCPTVAWIFVDDPGGCRIASCRLLPANFEESSLMGQFAIIV